MTYEEFQGLHNFYKGERCFVFGTGPSLCFEDPHLIERVLEQEITFGCNGLFLWDRLPRPPTYYGVIDHPAFPLWRKQIEELDTIRIAGLRQDWPGETPAWIRVLQRRDMPLTEGHFSGLEETFTWCAGRTNVVWALLTQLTFWMGFQQVYLLGVDGLLEDGPRLHCYEVADFFAGKIKETRSDYNERTVRSLQKAVPVTRHIYEEHGRELVNLNPTSFVSGIPKNSLKEVLA